MKVTNCDGKTWLGGYKVFGPGDHITKEISGLPKHSSVSFSFEILMIDDWQPNVHHA